MAVNLLIGKAEDQNNLEKYFDKRTISELMDFVNQNGNMKLNNVAVFCCVYCYVFVNSLCEAFVSVFVLPLCLYELSIGNLSISVSSMQTLVRKREKEV